MADNALAKQVGKKMPERRKTRLEQIADEMQAYGGRVRDDFMAGAERSAQGLGDIVERGDVLTGIPRLALGGTAWMGAPVSAALSPILNPILQPVGEAVNTYVGQPVEDLTGYPADITNDLAMTGLTLGVVKGLGMTRPYLARAADQVEGMANRAGYTLRKPANVYGSGPTLTPLVNEVDGGLIAYHGTTEKGIPRLRTRNAVETPGAVFASSKDDVAETFTVPREYGEPVFADEFGNEIARGEVLKLKLQPKNTLVYPEAEGQKFIDDTALQARVVKEAKAAGHDMIHVKNVMEGIGERFPGDVYVILDDSIISILKRYGIPMTAAAGGGMMVMGQDMPPEVASQIGG
jgi:hypothetical protein